MKSFEELGAAVRRSHRSHGLAGERDTVLMIVLVSTTSNGQTMLLVLGISPEQVVESPQGIDFQVGEWIAPFSSALVLKAQADRIHRLHELRLLHPIRPDELEKTGMR